MTQDEIDRRYPNWREWWLVARFKERFPNATPTPRHIQAMAAIVEGLGSPWNISTSWDRCKWNHAPNGAISFACRRDLATHDFNHLTSLVLAAHKHSVRVEIEPCTPTHLRIIFWPRDPAATSNMARHPTLAELAERAASMDWIAAPTEAAP